nr:RagB/SusD family nutrient uptake outer membrane protein [Mucilaginibacter sp. L294]
MKKYISIISILTITLVYSSCKVDRIPETSLPDVKFWNTETDLQNAANRLYEQLAGYTIDTRSDEYVGTVASNISNSTRGLVATSDDWNVPYRQIFTANNILEKGVKAAVSDAIKNRYFGEARFFRAYYHFMLVQKYGDVPLVLKTLAIDDPDLNMPRTDREAVIKAVYDDLDFAATWLPTRAALPTAQYGRVTKSSALALKARIALYEGTWLKFRNKTGWEDHLQKAVDAATAVMGQGHSLYKNYPGVFLHEGEGPTNTENIFVKIYGVSTSNLILAHNTSRDLENGRIAPTRNLLRIFNYSDGLPAFNTDGTVSATKSPLFVPENAETSYNMVMDNRDPRLATLVWRAGEVNWKGPWVPIVSLGVRSGLAGKKGWNAEDWAINSGATVDKPLIRYGEVLLTLAEAKYELAGAISDADLNITINALRTRAGMPVKLSNAFVAANNLNMREEIRRERTMELCLEGFRYDDLIRWKTAETVLPKSLLGAKYTVAEWIGTNASSLKLNSDNIIIIEDAGNRNTFDANRDYLYPIPLNEISLTGGIVKQNPGWN